MHFTELNAFLSATTSNAGGSSASTTVVWGGFPLPYARDFYKQTTNADLMQPGLGPLQPNLDDVDLDWLSSLPSTSDRNGLEAVTVTKNSNDLLAAVVTATTASNNHINHNGQVQQQQPLMMVPSQFVPPHQLSQPVQQPTKLLSGRWKIRHQTSFHESQNRAIHG